MSEEHQITRVKSYVDKPSFQHHDIKDSGVLSPDFLQKHSQQRLAARPQQQMIFYAAPSQFDSGLKLLHPTVMKSNQQNTRYAKEPSFEMG